jgi:hypothetical protein
VFSKSEVANLYFSSSFSIPKEFRGQSAIGEFGGKIETFRFMNGRPAPDSIFLMEQESLPYVMQFSDVEDKAAWIGPYHTHLMKPSEGVFPAGPRSPNIGKWLDVQRATAHVP